jgi:hypothetical protein
MRCLFFLVLAACTGTEKSADSVMDSEGVDATDSESTTTTTDTGTPPEATGIISGSVVAYDGTKPADVTVQVCSIICYSISTDGNGTFIKEKLKADGYKVEAFGSVVKGHDFGNLRMHVDLADAENHPIDTPLYLPKVTGPVVNSGSPMTLGAVHLSAAVDALKVPFGEDDNTYWAGTVESANIPPFWGLTDPALAVAFLPLGTEVSKPIQVSVDGSYPAGNFDVYSVDEHGSVEGPVGTATSDGTTVVAKDLSPTILSWLIFVPSM